MVSHHQLPRAFSLFACSIPRSYLGEFGAGGLNELRLHVCNLSEIGFGAEAISVLFLSCCGIGFLRLLQLFEHEQIAWLFGGRAYVWWKPHFIWLQFGNPVHEPPVRKFELFVWFWDREIENS